MIKPPELGFREAKQAGPLVLAASAMEPEEPKLIRVLVNMAEPEEPKLITVPVSRIETGGSRAADGRHPAGTKP